MSCLPFLSQDPRNRLGHCGSTIFTVQQPNSRESLYKDSTVSGIGISNLRGEPDAEVTASPYVSLTLWRSAPTPQSGHLLASPAGALHFQTNILPHPTRPQHRSGIMPKLANLGRDESLICKSLGYALLAKPDTCPLRPWGITIFCGISAQRAAAAPAPQGLVEELLRPPQPDAAAVQPSQGAQEPPPESLRSPPRPGKEDPLPNPK